ncbi:MAG: hypothetical protein DSZ23_02655 [Thermodesulfatator sp.]|nr:MAG: hypothetical protein DSZ23_02655 [Thermodesulfatator sp.]
MNLFKKFVKYSQFSTGDFENIFAGFQVPPCPQVVLELVNKLRNPDIDIEQIVSVLESDASLAGQILKAVNSALYALPAQVTSINKAVSILGLREIENIAIGYAMTKTVKDPEQQGFDITSYWTESILRALFARNCASVMEVETEEAFSAGLLQDIAVPQLLSQWFQVYSRAYNEWLRQGGDLHSMETHLFSWNHCQAGAWIARKWKLPDLLICCIGLHGASQTEIRELKLENTAVAPVALSSRLTLTGFSEQAAAQLAEQAGERGIGTEKLLELVKKSEKMVEELAGVFGVRISSGIEVSNVIEAVVHP